VSMLTVRQTVEQASVSQSLVCEWCSSGILPRMRLGRPGKRGCIRIDEAHLESFLTE
jgi:hypothetical protein